MFDHCSSMDKWSNCLNNLETVRTFSQIIDIIMATVKHHFFLENFRISLKCWKNRLLWTINEVRSNKTNNISPEMIYFAQSNLY